MARAARWRWWPLGEARGLVLTLGERMRRRQFFTLLGSMAIAWPIDADAQKPNQVRRIGVLMPYASDDAVERSQQQNGLFSPTTGSVREIVAHHPGCRHWLGP
jgi:hypothetical protein